MLVLCHNSERGAARTTIKSKDHRLRAPDVILGAPERAGTEEDRLAGGRSAEGTPHFVV